MIERITVGAVSLMGALIVGSRLSRWYVTPPRARGRHRAPRAVEVSFAELMPDWPQPAYGAAIPQAFRPCRGCGGDVPVVLHPGAHTCSAGHITITTTKGE